MVFSSDDLLVCTVSVGNFSCLLACSMKYVLPHGCAVITVHHGTVGIDVAASVCWLFFLRICTTEICMKVHSQYGELSAVLRVTSLRA